MVSVSALWLPILLSTVIVFFASFILHMVLKYHWNDYAKFPKEDDVLDALRRFDIAPGTYVFPRPADVKDMQSPELLDKYNKGPVGFVTVLPSAPPAMGKSLVQWFIFCLVIGVFAAYLTGRSLGANANYMMVFRMVSCIAFLGYGATQILDSIWKSQKWSTTFKHLFDGLIYALLTGGVFGWLWPHYSAS